MKTKNFELRQFKAAEAEDEQGTFEALVAVYNNVDRGGDRIVKGAFADSLAEWEQKGRPVPIIFAHQWDNLNAHIGQVLDAEERDEGLYIKGRLDLEEDGARRVWKLMKAGRLAEFSFAYDVEESEMIDQGAKATPRYVNELRRLSLLECGPCLVGMNPETQLLGVKEGIGFAEMVGRIMSNSIGGSACSDSGSEDEGATEDEAVQANPADSPCSKSSGPHPSVIAARVAIELASDL